MWCTTRRQFDYHIGEITEEHAEHGKIKSSPTTQLVDRIVLSNHHVLSYEYDKEERITKVTDSFEGQADDVTEYTYDWTKAVLVSDFSVLKGVCHT